MQLPVSEEFFLNELHSYLNLIDQVVSLASEIYSLSSDGAQRGNMREHTPNSRSHSNGRVVMETPIRGVAALNRNKSTTAMH